MAEVRVVKARPGLPMFLWPLLAVVGVALLALGAGLGYGAWSKAHSLIGTSLHGDPAPNFTLIDQTGRQVSLADFRGKPVVLTFLYTHCPDVCPIIADKLRSASDKLGAGSSKVAIVAITTDPAHDDRLSIERFSQQHGMTGRWSYLIGSPGQLEPVWKSYYVAAQPIAGDQVLHTAAVYVIDKQGRERAYLDGGDFLPDELVHDLNMLINE